MAEESLIPKKLPTARLASEGFGVLFRIALAIFLVAALFTGGLYLYRNYLTNNLNDQKSVLAKLNVEFEPTLIAELERVSNSITAAREVLRNHNKTSAIFDILEKNTLPATNFTALSYSLDKNSVTLSGEAASYSDVSAQSSVFESLSEILSATFSNLALRDSGAVGFTLNIVLKK